MSKYVGFRLGKVHESHVISEYYCGGCGWPVTDHDSFCPECGGAFRKYDADNLEDENAKLRELAKELFKLADRGLMELDDNDFRRIVKEAEGLGLTDSLDEVRAPGRGTCRVMYIGEFNGEATEYYDICSNCCYEFDDDPLNYCPNCGARIEVDA